MHLKMKKFYISFIALLCVSYATSDECMCVERKKCEGFGYLNLHQKNPCPVPNGQQYGQIFGHAAAAKGDYVCCPSALVTLDNSHSAGQQGYHMNNNFGYGNGNSGYNQNGYNHNENLNKWAPHNTVNNPNYFDNGVNNQNVGRGNPGFDNNGYNPQAALPPYGYQHVNALPKNLFPTNHNPHVTSSPLFYNGHNFGDTTPGGQCAITSFPPKPETGCCGREASDTDRIIASNAPITHRPPQAKPSWPWMEQGFPRYGTPFGRRVGRSAEKDNVHVTIDDRIASGRETEIEQFPWTVLLRTTFDYGKKKTAFDCGGSLISSRYVLTAGHCVFDQEGKIIKVEVFLAEYDKRTFPKDCKIVVGQGEKCIENVVMEAEDVILHPQYDDSQLSNDIALIRLHGTAPYTNYIRPICLPSIDVDTPDFLNLRLAVAGWGRNGRYRSDTKQSTIVNLVPQEKCRKFYPGLSRGQVCAAGYRGEDTCKGDSGGPLMTVYSGKYAVVGVVSGKRADAPCGTAVPSLYTNVYHYLDWIHTNIKN